MSSVDATHRARKWKIYWKFIFLYGYRRENHRMSLINYSFSLSGSVFRNLFSVEACFRQWVTMFRYDAETGTREWVSKKIFNRSSIARSNNIHTIFLGLKPIHPLIWNKLPHFLISSLLPTFIEVSQQRAREKSFLLGKLKGGKENQYECVDINAGARTKAVTQSWGD